MTRILVHHAPIKPRRNGADIPVLVYGSRAHSPSGYSIGNSILDRISRLGVAVPDVAFDLVTIALAVTAADTFANRRQADDGWSRRLELEVSVSRPLVWESTRPSLETALNFLTGDMWSLQFRQNGLPAPIPFTSSHGRRLIPLEGADCVCLFSGGLDSTIGVLDLLAQGFRPMLVSHAYRGDRQVQDRISTHFPLALPRFSFNASPFSPTANDVTMRSRSLNFIALGALNACAVARANGLDGTKLIIPENGFISLNPPLTPRRIGALSTRTTHPYFILLMREVLQNIGLDVELVNPYQLRTKGEMIASCQSQKILREVAPMTVSCGKWKRSGQQCGRCVPCIIRRASFFAAGFKDRTDPPYRNTNLSEVMRTESWRDDLLATAIAARTLEGARSDSSAVARWVMLSGPLPEDAAERHAYGEVAYRGICEISSFLKVSRLWHD